MPQDLKAAILAALNKTEDPGLKSVLLLLLQALDYIGSSVEDVHRDLRAHMENVAIERVELFNGHIKVHEKHHDWVADQIDAGKDNRRELRGMVFDLVKTALIAAAAFVAGRMMGG